jgi:hypothetical protein
VWARLWVLAARGWQRWPNAADRVREALNLALLQAVELPDNSDRQSVLAGLEDLDIDEDDGSTEWQYVTDLDTVLTHALSGGRTDETLDATIRTFLDGVFIVVANDSAEAAGRPISAVEAEEAVANSAFWRKCVALVNAL